MIISYLICSIFKQLNESSWTYSAETFHPEVFLLANEQNENVLIKDFHILKSFSCFLNKNKS